MEGPAEAAKKIGIYVAIDMNPRRIRDVLIEIIQGEGWKDEEESAQELEEKWACLFHKYLKKKASEESKWSQICRFEFNSANELFIQGSCYVEPNSSPAERAAKKRRSNCVQIRDTLDGFSDQQFEGLCAEVLRLMFVKDPTCTKYNKDHGIDFFGKMLMGEIVNPPVIGPGAEDQIQIWLVGQAKNYRSLQVTTKEIREMIGSVSLARSKTFVGDESPYPNLELRLCDPVISLFLTSGTISRDAFSLMRKAGIVAMDGNQLSVFLADRNVGVVNGGFDKKLFNDWALGNENVPQ